MSSASAARGGLAVEPQVGLRGPDQRGTAIAEVTELVPAQRGAVDDHGGAGERTQLHQVGELVDRALVVPLSLGQVDVEGVDLPLADGGEDVGHGVRAAPGRAIRQVDGGPGPVLTEDAQVDVADQRLVGGSDQPAGPLDRGNPAD